MAQVLALGGHMDGGADLVAGVPLDADLLHELVVAGADELPVHPGADAAAGELLHIGDAAGVQGRVIGVPERAGDGVVGVRLRQGGQLQKPGLRALVGVDGSHVEHALGQGAGLIKNDYLRVGEDLQVVAALDQDALLGSPADAAEEGEGH